MPSELSSSGHKLGQVVGDWYEEYFAVPVLENLASKLNLYLDHRFRKRSCRGNKILWMDSQKNSVDYDFVLEIDGTDDKKGVPVAFFETFWRRGARHSKDKARDDSGKLMPAKQSFPTARVIGIISAGDFTEPARELVLSRGIDLFYVDKSKIIEAWAKHGIQIDYEDWLPENDKLKIVNRAVEQLKTNEEVPKRIAETLKEIVGETSLTSYMFRLVGKLGAIPQQYQLVIHVSSKPIVFSDIKEVSVFLSNKEPNSIEFETNQLYTYEVVFADGDSYFGESLTWAELNSIHHQLEVLINHMSKVIK